MGYFYVRLCIFHAISRSHAMTSSQFPCIKINKPFVNILKFRFRRVTKLRVEIFLP